MRNFLIFFSIILFSVPAARSYAQDYIVGEGDVLKISVYKHPDLTTVDRVSGEGEIVIPLIGNVKVGGMLVSEIADRIAAMLADGYIKKPQVSVFVDEYRSRKAVVMGQVNSPGLYVLHGNITLLELISKAGGLTKDAGDSAVIKRKSNGTDGREKRILIDLKRLIEQGDLSLDVPVMDGDSVFVNKLGTVYVSGQVKNPGVFVYEDGLTVIKAITMAGGLTEKASPTRVKIIRKKEGVEELRERVNMDEPVFEDDVIVVPESYF